MSTDFLRQQAIDAMFDDRVRLPTTNFHDYPWPRLNAFDLVDHRLRYSRVAILIDIFHCGFLAATSSTTGASSSVSWSICSSNS